MFQHPFIAIPDVIATHGRFRGTRPALADQADTLDWQATADAVARGADVLRRQGIGRGDAVVLLVGNGVTAIVALFAVMRAGGICVPLSPMLDPATLQTMLRDSGARLILADPALAAVASPLGKAGGTACLQLAAGWWSAGDPASARPGLAPDDDCNIIYSSGTTGIPKGIVHSHAARALAALGLALEFRIDRSAVVLVATPLFTNGTWMMLLPAAVAGARCVSLTRFDAEAFLAAVERHRVTHVFVVPTMIRALLDHPKFARYDLSSLRIVISAGSALPAAWKREAIERLGGRLLELYGLTEGVATTLHPEDMADHGATVGTPMPGIDLRIVDDAGAVQRDGEIGEIVGYGSGLMSRYHNRPDATAAAIWRDELGRTFLRTGDIGRLDGGFLTIVDRKKDMIVSGGINVFAIDIENILREHAAVADVAVIAEPHPKWVETPVAIVVARPGVAIDPAALMEWANARLGKFQRLSRVIEADADFPRNALGKVLKRELRDRHNGRQERFAG